MNFTLLPDSHYCPVCQYPFDSDGSCYECRKRQQQDSDQLKTWIEKIGGYKAWKEYLEQNFVRTAYNNNALAAAKAFDYRRSSILFYGPRGTGKSHLAAIIKRPLVMNNVDVLTVSMPEVLGDIKQHIKSASVLQGWVSKMVRARVLSIEDLGVEKPSEWSCEVTYRIIDGRYKQAKPGMIVTTNLSPEGLESHWGFHDTHGRIVSRLKEMCVLASTTGEKDWRAEKDPA